jgi:hypothetical protein
MIGLKYRGLVCRLALCALTTTVAGCGTDFPDTAPTPTPPIVTESPFTGTLTPNGGITLPFISTSQGTVELTVISLADDNGPAAIGPDGAIRIGMSLGTWNGTACYSLLTNDNSFVATILTATATSAGPLCARVYDSQGKLTSPVTFEIKITHP